MQSLHRRFGRASVTVVCTEFSAFSASVVSWSSGETISSFYVLYGVTFKLSVTSLCRKIKKIARYRTFFSPNLFLRLLMIYYAVKCPHLYPGIWCSLLNLFIIISKSTFQKCNRRKTWVLCGESDLLKFLQHQVVSGTPWIS